MLIVGGNRCKRSFKKNTEKDEAEEVAASLANAKDITMDALIAAVSSIQSFT